MSTYLSNVHTAVLLFPLIAAALSVPYAIYQYRKFGSISLWKTFLVFSFIFYLLCAYFMVILPLPADRDILIPAAQTPQLQPFFFMDGMLAAASHIEPSSPASWIAFLRNPGVYTTLFNVLLTLPFGVYLRYLFQCRWWQAILFGFMLSAFYEISQFSGLFGLYVHPYRLFDVDDLITNTTGSLLGFWCAIPLCHFLPDIDDVEELAALRGATHTSASRRLLAFAIDVVATVVVLAGLRIAMPGLTDSGFGLIGGLMCATGITFMLIPVITRGQTIGHMVVRLRVVRPDGSRASGFSIAARYGLLFWVFLLAPLWVSMLFPVTYGNIQNRLDEAAVGAEGIWLVLVCVYGIWLVSLAIRAVLSAFKHPFVMLNGLITNTRVMSVTQVDRLRAARFDPSMEEELTELDVDPLGTDLDDAFDASFDITSADEGTSFDAEEQGHI